MKAKKILSMIVSMFILATIVAVPAVAATGYAITPSGAAVAKYGSTYELTIKVTSPDNVYGAGCFVAYDTAIFTPVTENITGCAALNPNMVESVTVNGKTAIKINSSNDAATYNGETVWATIPFTVADGTDNVDTSFELIYSNNDADMNGKITWLDKDFNEIAFTDITFGQLNIKAVLTHTAPTITGVEVTSPAVVGTELTATTVGFSDSWGLPDASTFAWVIDGKTVSTSNKYTPVIADINKTITVTATPTVEEQEGMDAGTNVGEAKSTTAKVVIPADYAPTVAVEIGENDEVLAAMPVEPVVTYDETYKAVTEYAVEYTYYVVPATLIAEDAENKLTAAIAAVEAATEGVVTLDSNVYSADNKDDYAVVKAEATYTIGGEVHATKPVAYAAALIKGEPPVLDEIANGEKLAGKKLYTSTTVTVTEKDVKFISNAVGDDDSIAYTYAWYVSAAKGEYTEEDAIDASAIMSEAGNKISLSKQNKIASVEGKYLTLVVTATDALGISAETTIAFDQIKKAASSGGSGTTGGASLVTKPEADDPATEDPDYVADNNVDGDPTDGKETTAATFTDVDKEVYAWGYDYLDKLAKAGVVKGMTATTYEPESMTTYAQFTALVVRVLGLEAEEAATEKVAKDHWSYAEVSVADKLGLLADVAFNADKAITREDMAVIAYKALKANGVELTAGEAVEYSDASSISEYAVESIDALSKAGILNGMGDGTFAPKGTTTRMQTAKVIGMIAELVD